MSRSDLAVIIDLKMRLASALATVENLTAGAMRSTTDFRRLSDEAGVLFIAGNEERAALAAALLLACGNYPPCDQCGVFAAEWWRWSDPIPDHGEGLDMTALCDTCLPGGERAQPAEPADHIAAIAKVRHLLRPTSVQSGGGDE